MKKILLLAVIALGVTATSCRKERTCECKTTYNEVRVGYQAQVSTYNTSDKTTMAKQKKNEFKYAQSCFSSSSTSSDSGGSGQFSWTSTTTSDRTCEIK